MEPAAQAARAAAAHPPPALVRARLVPCQPAGARLVLHTIEEVAQLRLDVGQDGVVAVAISLRRFERAIGAAGAPPAAAVRLHLVERGDGMVAAALTLEEDQLGIGPAEPSDSSSSSSSSSAGACVAQAPPPQTDEAAGPSQLLLRHARLLQENSRLQRLVRQVR